MVSSKKRYKPRIYLHPLASLPAEYSFLSKDTRVLEYQSIFPFFQFKFTNKKGSWAKFCEVINRLETEEKCSEIEPEEIIPFLDDNPHIEFEIEMFEDMLTEIIYFKYLGKVHSYAVQQTSKNMITVRFFFDIKEFIG